MKLDRNILVYWKRLGLTLTIDDLEDHAVALAARLAEIKRILTTGLSHADQRNRIALLMEAADSAGPVQSAPSFMGREQS